jgi:hypothetical protein
MTDITTTSARRCNHCGREFVADHPTPLGWCDPCIFDDIARLTGNSAVDVRRALHAVRDDDEFPAIPIPRLTEDQTLAIIADARKPAWPVVAPDSNTHTIDCPALHGPWCEPDTDEEPNRAQERRT